MASTGQGTGTRRTTGRGQGSIRRLARPGDKPGKPTGLWEARATLGYADGKRIRRSFYGHTQVEATAAMTAAVAKAQQGTIVPSTALTVGAYLADWLDTSKRVTRDLQPTTRRRYREILERHVIPELGRIKLAQLSPQHVERMMTAVRQKGLSAQTINHSRNVLRTALTDAERHGLVTKNVAGGRLVGAEKSDREGIEPMDVVEARGILAATRDTALELPVALALWLGLRQGEVLGLRWRDVDTVGFATVKVDGALHRLGGVWSWGKTKTPDSRKTLGVPPPLQATLRAFYERLEALPLAVNRPDGLPADLVVVDPFGDPIEPTGLTGRFQTRLRQAGLRRRRFHDLRHGFACLALAAGLDIKVVSELMRHSTITVTANTYAKAAEKVRRDAADRIGALLG